MPMRCGAMRGCTLVHVCNRSRFLHHLERIGTIYISAVWYFTSWITVGWNDPAFHYGRINYGKTSNEKSKKYMLKQANKI